MLKFLITNILLKRFFKIDLSGIEKEITKDSIQQKYIPALQEGLVIGLMILPAIFFLDTAVLVNVLIPITMVAGTAWFAVSLANMKKKFENFGVEITTALFKSFVSALVILGLLAFFSLLPDSFNGIHEFGTDRIIIQYIASSLGVVVVIRVLWNLFAGALKYDINDSMLTGQTEAAEKFFKKSLSLLHALAENLRVGKGLEIANYYIGSCFYEIFSFIRAAGVLNGKLEGLMNEALKLKNNPEMSQEEADHISIELIEKFLSYCVNIEGEKSVKSYANIQDELHVLKIKKEHQEMVDTRLAIVFEEIAELIDLQGEGLFKKVVK